MASHQIPVHLLTSNFPFGRGEEFLPAEFPYLLETFERIVLYPTKVGHEAPGDGRSLPDRVSVNLEFVRSLAEARSRPSRLRLARALASVAPLPLLVGELPAAIRFGKAGGRALLRRIAKAKEILDALERSVPADGGPSILYSYWMDEAALAVTLFLRRHKAFVGISRAHGFDLYLHRQDPPYQPAQRIMVNGLTRTFAISEHGADDLKRRFPQAAGRIRSSRLGVHPQPFRAARSNDGVLRVVTCAYVTALKRLHLVAGALQRIEVPVDWSHIGDGPLLDSLKETAHALPKHIRVNWLGHFPHAALMDYYRAQPTDVFVNVSQSEGIPVSVMEALSVGIPAIATSVGGTPELVNDSNGALLPADPTPAQVADSLMRFAALGAEARQAKADQAVNTVTSRFNAERQYRQFAKTLLGLMLDAP